MLPRLKSALVRVFRSLGTHSNWFLGSPQRATVAAVVPAGYVLLIDYTNGRDWVTLRPRHPGEQWTALSTRPTDDRPIESELAAVDAALSARRLVRTEPWGIDVEGRLCASIQIARGDD
jgi:hypothetical protein